LFKYQNTDTGRFVTEYFKYFSLRTLTIDNDSLRQDRVVRKVEYAG